MKKLKAIIGILVFALLFCSGAQAQKIKLVSGDLSFFRDITELNTEFDFSEFGVGKFKTEQDYIDKKVKDYNKDEEGKGDTWEAEWQADKTDVFGPKFNEFFNLIMLAGENNTVSGDFPDAEYTMILKTTFLEPGYNVGISRKDAMINVKAIFVKTEDKSVEVAVITMDKVKGGGFWGGDFDAAYRIGGVYQEAGSDLASYILNKVY